MAYRLFEAVFRPYAAVDNALEMADINKNTPNPPGGTFDRDANGDLNGRVTDRATGVINRIGKRPSFTAEQMAQRSAKARGPMTPSDYSALDKPTIVRQRAVGDDLRADADPEELLDIPAFLRRQADWYPVSDFAERGVGAPAVIR